MSRRHVEALVDGLDYDDVLAVQEGYVMVRERAQLAAEVLADADAGPDEVDGLLESLELRLGLAPAAEAAALALDRRDARPYRRTRRRNERRAVRGLPSRLPGRSGSGRPGDGEAA